MTDQIKLVQGDDLPYINISLTDSVTGAPINLSDSSIVVRVFFKSVLKKTVLATIVCEKTDPVLGKVRFNFSGGVLNVSPGTYAGVLRAIGAAWTGIDRAYVAGQPSGVCSRIGHAWGSITISIAAVPGAAVLRCYRQDQIGYSIWDGFYSIHG